MRAASFFCGVSALVPLVNAQASTGAEAPLITASARTFFIFDTHPTGSLEASIIAYNRRNETYHVACPTADAACKKEGYWPATVTHIEGSSWIGTNTATEMPSRERKRRRHPQSVRSVLRNNRRRGRVDIGRVQSVRAPFVLVRVASYGDLCGLHKSGTIYRVGIWETCDWGNGKRVVSGRDRRRRDEGNGNQVGDRSRHRDGGGNGCGAVDVGSGEWV
ncbi:uncharacterized protein GLRG_08359 [Colletotrichum graminicola M1.001]|uniref:Uncharacterized protein n=1 Tax=Colletotrichum graminicola (strain M1.001 / M2 / FGSC 10212) TaxID=645133 RepID=E3QQS7_COLGM|nr:uncharacterized protein GLRG_08359 [Colletotrichum graminicola M1.001]EFQ33215.1 hypothetical protein GLRG_08359 [Colletotrichum graminicola M1.001]